MTGVDKRIRDLITSEVKLKTLEIINASAERFTAQSILLELRSSGVDVDIPFIRNFLRALCYRGYLVRIDLKIGNNRGRSTSHFERRSLALES